jgi:hypothetical protein
VESSRYNSDIKYFYHDGVWAGFDRTKLGKIPLNNLYKQRAEQLRDNYDYLILYYSGGSDSHNILKTFIDNDIKLDEVCVKWPKALMGDKLYTPNNVDDSSKNYWSEWDYCVKPILEWLAHNKPHIKITIKDYMDESCLDIDTKFIQHKNHGFKAGILLNSVISDTEIKFLNTSKTVGHIYGIDKPLIILNDNNLYMCFVDKAMASVVRSQYNDNSAEPFYWTPDFPEIAYEQAYQMCLFYRMNSSARQFLLKKTDSKQTQIINNQMQQEYARHVIYDNWDGRFQTKKPESDARLDKFYWLFNTTELNTTKEKFIFNMNERLSILPERLLTGSSSDLIRSVKPLITNYYYVTTLI